MSQPIAKSAQEHAAAFSPKLRTIALIVVATAFVMDLLDSTIVNVAIPTIQTSLLASFSAIQWVVAGYSLTFALLLVTGGRMGDVFGYKKIFLIGISGFTIASLLSGLSVNSSMLIVTRLFQGSMAALMVPQVISLMQVMYKQEERGRINGLFGTLGGAAASLGPIISGLLIKANIFGWEWRPIFLINVPIGILGILAAIKYLPEGKSPHPLKLDFAGTGLIIVALFLIVYPLIQGRELGWPLWSYVMLVASLPVLAIFLALQKRKERTNNSPLVLLSLFHNRSFSVGLLLNLLFQGSMIGFFLTFTLVLQLGLGYSAIHSALTGLPIAFAIGITMATLGEKVIPKLGRIAFNIGAGLMAIGLVINVLIFHHYQLGTHSWQLIVGLLFFGVGMGFVFASLFAAVLNGVDPKHAGSASGTLNAIQQVGAAIGVALIGVVFFGQLNHAAPSSYVKVEPTLRTSLTAMHIPSSEQTSISAAVERCFIDRSKESDTTVVPNSCKGFNSPADRSISQIIEKTSLEANAHNFTNAFKWSVIYEVAALAVAFVLVFWLPKHFVGKYAEI
jgi:EmrB/QacA subfamily drug resistance transporter